MEQNKKDREYYFLALKIIGDFGANIAVPVVVLALLGEYLDEKYNKAPLFILLGFLTAALISTKIIYTKAKKYGKMYQDLGEKYK
jgi:F0F1-type ATP synthase assembly protein I